MKRESKEQEEAERERESWENSKKFTMMIPGAETDINSEEKVSSIQCGASKWGFDRHVKAMSYLFLT